MENWLQGQGCTLEEFNDCLREAQEDGKTSEKYFLKLLIASGEYDCFSEVMIAEAKRQRNEPEDYDL